MAVAYAVKSHYRKFCSIFRRDFNSSKCKTWAKMTTARIKLLRNKRETVVRQMRRDVALLLQSGQDATARIRVEHVIREQKMMAANEILELFCERIVSRLSIIAKRKECPADLKEAISSLIFAGPRCSDIPELLAIRDIFLKKYGKDFVSAATDLRPDSGVNRLLIEKLSALNPPGELKLKVMKEIAKEYQVEWDASETEAELLKPPEKRMEGPRTFISASSLPLNTRLAGGGDNNNANKIGGGSVDYFEDATSAAKAAAQSAKDAVAAAQAAAQLVQKESSRCNSSSHAENHKEHHLGINKKQHCRSQSFGVAGGDRDQCQNNAVDLNTRHGGYNIPSAAHTTDNIQFDDSDFDDDEDTETRSGMYPPSSNAKPGSIASSVHPNLPDYDTLSARFEALKYRKS